MLIYQFIYIISILLYKAYSTIAQCIAILCVNTPEDYCSTAVDDFIDKISVCNYYMYQGEMFY